MTNNLATVQSIYEAFGKGDIPAILDKVAEDVRWEDWADNSAQKAGVPWLKPRQGRNGVVEFFQTLGAMQVNEFKVLSLMDGGQQIAAEFVLDVNVPDTGGHYRDEEIHLWTFNDQGQVIRLRHYTDTAKHIAAAKA
jgi:ketosteroid isomerase-like protein